MSSGARAAACPTVSIPSRRSRAAKAGPTPGIRRTGSGARNARVSARPMTENPRGLSRSEASLASSLLWLSPIDTVTPSSRSTRRANPASSSAALAPADSAAAARSRYASSIDTGCTRSQSSSIAARTSAPAARYFAMSGASTTASGQAASALNIGMAEPTPDSRAM